jgi:hypothetical protein
MEGHNLAHPLTSFLIVLRGSHMEWEVLFRIECWDFHFRCDWASAQDLSQIQFYSRMNVDESEQSVLSLLLMR